MISKELMSEVLGYRVLSNILIQEEIIIKLNFEYFQTKYANDEINIYELAYKCKEWATYKGYELKSSKPIVSNDEGKQVFNYWWMAWLFKFDGGYESPKQILLPSFIGENEPKAIFKACQWILDNKQKGKI